MMHRSASGLVGIVIVGLCAASAATAQVLKPGSEVSRRHGFWFSLGVASGSVGMQCSGCDSHRETGASGTVRLGGTLSPHWLLGAEVDAFSKSSGGVDQAFGNVALVASWYPSRTGGFFLKFGLGAMRYTIDDGTDKLEYTGGSGIIGVGWDIPLGRTLSLTPYLNSIASANTTVKLDGTTVPDVSMNPNLVQFGVAISLP